MEQKNGLGIESLVGSITSSISQDAFIADTSALFTMPDANIRYCTKYSDMPDSLADKWAFFYERMLGVVGMNNLLLPSPIRGELNMLLYQLRLDMSGCKSPAFRRLGRAADMMHRVVCAKRAYAPSPAFEEMLEKINDFRMTPFNYERAENCSKEDLVAITSVFDLASSAEKAGFISRDNPQMEFCAKIARHLDIPINLATYDRQNCAFSRRDYKTLGEWDSHIGNFAVLSEDSHAE